MNEHNVNGIELDEEMLEHVAGGLTSSQVGQRGDAVPPLNTRLDLIHEPQAYLSWTHWVPHPPRG